MPGDRLLREAELLVPDKHRAQIADTKGHWRVAWNIVRREGGGDAGDNGSSPRRIGLEMTPGRFDVELYSPRAWK